MTKVELNFQLYQKMFAEQEAYKAKLLTKPPAEILDTPLKLTSTEYKLLYLLAKDAGKVLTHTYLTDKIGGSSWASDMASLRVHIATFRKKRRV